MRKRRKDETENGVADSGGEEGGVLNASFGSNHTYISNNSSFRGQGRRKQVLDDSALTGAIALGTLSFAGHVVVDAFCISPQAVPDLPLLIVSTVLMLLAGPLAHYSGSWTVPGYEIWQPFKGGDHFVILQMLGWLFFAVWCVCIAIVLNSRFTERSPVEYGNGVISFVGFLGFVATLLLVWSPHYFKPSEAWRLPFGELLQKQKESLLAVMTALLSFLLGTGLDAARYFSLIEPWTASQLQTVCVMGFCLTTAVSHWIGTRVHSPHYKLYQPFQGGFRFVLMQCIGWAGASVVLYIHLNVDVVNALPSGTSTLLSWLFLLCSFVLLCSVELFEPNSPVFMVWTGERLASFMLSVIATSLFFLIDILQWYYGENPPISYFNMSLCGGILIFSIPVLTQYLASRQTKGYAFFQPFIGGTRFVAIQAFGWTIYAASLIVWLLFMINEPWKHVFSVGIFGFLADTAILVSPTLFEPETVPEDTSMYLNGELILSTLLAMGGVAIFHVVDVLDDTVFPRQQLLVVAALAVLSSTVVAQFCGRKAHEGFKTIQPFEGGAEFVALQSMAWTIFAVMLIFFVILIINFDQLVKSFAPPWLTVCGCIGILPWGIILASIGYYQDAAGKPISDIQVSVRFSHRGFEMTEKVLEELDELLPQVSSPELRVIISGVREECVKQREATRLFPSLRQDSDTHPVTTLVATGVAVMALTLCAVADIFDAIAPEDVSHAATVVFAAGGALLLAPPVLVHCRTGPSKYKNYKLWQPFRGGFNFVLLQTIGWCLFSITCVLITMLLAQKMMTAEPGSAGSKIVGLSSLTGIFGTASYCVILLSLSHFQDSRHEVVRCGQDSFLQRNAEWTVSLLMTLGASALFAAVESVRNQWGDVFSVAPVFFLSGLALFASIPLMYIAVRKSRKLRPLDDLREDSGDVFGWIMYGLQAALATMFTCQAVLAVIPLNLLSTLLVITTTVTIVGQAGFYLVIFWNEGRNLSTALHDALEEVAANIVTMGMYLLPMLIYSLWGLLCFGIKQSVSSMYYFIFMHFLAFSHIQPAVMACVKTVSAFGVVVGLYLLLWSGDAESAFWVLLACCYTMTYNNDHVTGARTSKWAVEAYWFWRLLGRYFGLEVVVDSPSLKDDLAGGRPLVFGFHPHGIYPVTCVYASLHEKWREKVGVQPSIHCASIVFGPPLLREVVMMLGGRDVSWQSLENQLSQGGAALLVPGGQAEMRESSSYTDEVTLVSKHKGFVRLAIQNGAMLVPVFSLGEHRIMDNVRLPNIQQWFLQRIGFGYPHFPYGRLLLPLPRREKVYILVGKPIHVQQADNPTLAEVDRVHSQYYNALRDLVDRHKAECGFPDVSIKFK